MRLLCVAINGGRQRRVPIDHILWQRQWLLVGRWHVGRDLFSFHDNGSFLHVDQVDGFDSFGLVWDGSLDVLGRDNRHGLDHADARPFLSTGLGWHR